MTSQPAAAADAAEAEAEAATATATAAAASAPAYIRETPHPRHHSNCISWQSSTERSGVGGRNSSRQTSTLEKRYLHVSNLIFYFFFFGNFLIFFFSLIEHCVVDRFCVVIIYLKNHTVLPAKTLPISQ